MHKKFVWVLFVCLACSSCGTDTALLIKRLQEEDFLDREKPELQLRRLERMIEAIIAEEEFCRDWLPSVFLAVSRYQVYFFIQPDGNRFRNIQRYYAFLDKWQAADITCDFQKTREILTYVEYRSRHSQENLQKLLEFWELYPNRCQEFIEKVKAPYEVGGVIFSTPESVSWEFIEDQRRAEYERYLREFRENNFENIGHLEEIFIKRFHLHTIGGDSTARAYTDSILTAARFHFTRLRQLDTTAPALTEIEKSKEALLSLGLEDILLKQTYFFDRSPYLCDPDTAFFFHSHPYTPTYPYPKPPSGHDEEMALRIGPSLVFDVRNDRVVVYLVVLGKTRAVYRYFPSPPSSLWQ